MYDVKVYVVVIPWERKANWESLSNFCLGIHFIKMLLWFFFLLQSICSSCLGREAFTELFALGCSLS